MKKRILITGGAGFIGINLAQFYLKANETILCIDKDVPVVPDVKKYWKPVNLLDKDGLIAVVRDFQPTHVMHLAARTDLGGKNLSDYAVNTTGTLNLIEAIHIAGNVQRIIFASSMLVCYPGYIPVHDLDFAPATVYGESKKEMELLVRQQNLTAEWVIVRPTSIWGPWFKTPYRDFFDRVMSGSMYTIKGKASAKTYGFVLNTVYQLDKLLTANSISGQLFYLGDTPPINITRWANHVSDKLERKRPPEIPYPIFAVAAKFGDILGKIGLVFPMTSFRLKNMTTSNVLPLENLYTITGPVPYSQDEAITLTLDWINNNNK